MAKITEKTAKDIISRLKPHIHDLDSTGAESAIKALAKDHGMTEEGITAFGKMIAGKNENEAMQSITKVLEDSSKAWHQKGVTQGAKNVVKGATSRIGKLGKWAGIAGAVGAGALVVSAALSSKRAASEEKLANEPADLTPPMQPSMPMMAQQQMAMDPRTGFTPPVEAEWVERTGRGGQQAGFVQPEQMVMPASHVDAVQSRSSDKGEMAVTA